MPTIRRSFVVLGVSALLVGSALAQSPPPPPGGGPPDAGGDRPRGGEGRGGFGGFGRGGGGGGGGEGGGARRGGFMRGAGGMGEALQPEFATRDLPLFAEGLGLDDPQQMIVRTLIDDYAATFALGLEPVTAAMQEMGPALMRSFMSPESRERMRGAFESAQEAIRVRTEQAGELSPEERQAVVEETMAKTLEEIRASRQDSGEAAETQRIMGEMVSTFDGWRTKRQAMRESFIANLKGQLTPEQDVKWPAFERQLDREKTLPRGQLSGESTDLLRVVADLELEPSVFSGASAVLEGYELRLAEALKSRNDYLAQTEPRLMRAVQEMDIKTGLDIVKKQVQYRVRVRDVNEEFRTTIAAALPPEAAEAFTKEALKASFDRVFRKTRADEVLEYVRSLELSPEIVAQVDAIELAYRQELAASNEKLMATMKKEEPLEQVRQAERFAGFMSGGFGGGGPFGGRDNEDPVRIGFRERREMAERHVERLAAILAPEQLEGMPKGERRSVGGGIDNLPEEVRTRILERVDTNKNGQIDPEEQEEAARMFRDRGRNGGGPGGGGPPQ